MADMVMPDNRFASWTPEQLAREKIRLMRSRVISEPIINAGDGLEYGASKAQRYVHFFASKPETSPQDNQYLLSLLPNLQVNQDTIYTLNALGIALASALMELPESTIEDIRQGKQRIHQELQMIPPLAVQTRRLFEDIRISSLVLRATTVLVNTAEEQSKSTHPPATADPTSVHIFSSLAPSDGNPWNAPTAEQIAQVRVELIKAQADLLILHGSELSFLDLELRKEGLYLPRE